ncbi:hypothetical protein GQ55_9G154300 [Panicum hallii var. hallii]|uniref:WAT1-related protein n=1 Tax=Panicum hallii var. hallii TaxID=1504633 RepID=A0A2T7C3R0_9POAL|nr:hypothetical protein GQ55_9G154300 [Panicum hallii var. hallii]
MPAVTFFLAVLLRFYYATIVSPLLHSPTIPYLRLRAEFDRSQTTEETSNPCHDGRCEAEEPAAVLKEYPDKMVVTVAQCLCLFSTAPCFVVAVVAERDFSKWRLRLDVSLLAVLYSGFMVTGVSYYLQTWCIEMRGGPMFFAAWTPLCFVLTIFCSSFFLGSIVGGILLVGSLYTMVSEMVQRKMGIRDPQRIARKSKSRRKQHR